MINGLDSVALEPTKYAIAQGAFTDNNNKTGDGKMTGEWWLRSSSRDQSLAAYINDNGSLSDFFVDYDAFTVRPAFWLNLESDIF